MVPEIATRVYNHTFRIDPIVRTLLDTDFYKLLMLQMIWKHHRHMRVTFQLINAIDLRVWLADIVEERELIDQLDHARTLSFAKNELIWLAGNTFYGTTQFRVGSWSGSAISPAGLRADPTRRPVRADVLGLWLDDTTCGRSRRSPSSTSSGRARRCAA